MLTASIVPHSVARVSTNLHDAYSSLGLQHSGDTQISTQICVRCQQQIAEYWFTTRDGFSVATYRCAEHGALVAGEGKFDVITFGPFWTPDFAPYLSDMPATMRGTAAWNDILPVYRDRLMVWNGRYLSQTIDGDQHILTGWTSSPIPRNNSSSRSSTATTWPRRRPGSSTTK